MLALATTSAMSFTKKAYTLCSGWSMATFSVSSWKSGPGNGVMVPGVSAAQPAGSPAQQCGRPKAEMVLVKFAAYRVSFAGST